MRTEYDSLGTVEVPDTVYYGAQTVRALENFAISGLRTNRFPTMIRALGLIKKAAAKTNQRIGDLSAAKANAIISACDDVVAGKLDDQFVVDLFQGGAGTSTNMNANEVIANRALEYLGHGRGQYEHLHPINDVNLSQSTNDVYPTAIRLALLLNYPDLSRHLEELATAFEAKGNSFAHVLKLGRTQLQDAVPMTLGQEFRAFGVTIREDVLRLREAASLLHEINLGGTAIGTGITADPRYSEMVIRELAELSGLPLVPAANLIEACWDTGAFVQFSGTLKRAAVKLSKISNDLRLLSSGPRGGLGEIMLPAVQPGSSIMPGKVNPVIPEVVNQVAFEVIGNDLAVTLASEAGQLQLNAMEPLIAFNCLQSISLLCRATYTLRVRCVEGIEANEARCLEHLEAGAALATALLPLIGYERAAELAKRTLATGRSFRAILAEEGNVSYELLAQALDAEALTQPKRLRPAEQEEAGTIALPEPPDPAGE